MIWIIHSRFSLISSVGRHSLNCPVIVTYVINFIINIWKRLRAAESIQLNIKICLVTYI